MPKIPSTSSKLRRFRPPIQTESPRFQPWKILNSAIFIWFLSTVVVSYGSYKYAEWTQERKAEKEKAEKIVRLDQEISSRLDIFALPLSIVAEADSNSNKVVSAEEARVLYDSVLAPPSDTDALFIEYSKRGLVSLLKELSFELSGDERECVESALMYAKTLRKLNTETTAGKALGLIVTISDHRWSTKAQMAEIHRLVERIKRRPETNVDENSIKQRCGAVE